MTGLYNFLQTILTLNVSVASTTWITAETASFLENKNKIRIKDDDKCRSNYLIMSGWRYLCLIARYNVFKTITVSAGLHGDPGMFLDVPKRCSLPWIRLQTGFYQLQTSWRHVVVRRMKFCPHRVLRVVKWILSKHDDVQQNSQRPHLQSWT